MPTFTYDPSDGSVGRVRLLIGDTDTADAVYSDEEIAVFIAVESTINTAAALALETIASSVAMVVGKKSFLNNFEDGVSVSVELLKRGALLRSLDVIVI